LPGGCLSPPLGAAFGREFQSGQPDRREDFRRPFPNPAHLGVRQVNALLGCLVDLSR